MGYLLRREVRDAIPAGLLTAAERLLVLELADACSDKTREGYPGAETLAELTDLSLRSIQETLNRIAKKWVELRVPLGYDGGGRPYYSHAGKRTTFRFPPMLARQGATDPWASGATDPGASEQKGATDPGRRCDGSVQKVRQIRGPSPHRTSQENTSSLSRARLAASAPAAPGSDKPERDDLPSAQPQDPIRAILASHGCTGVDADTVINHATRLGDGQPKGRPWWRKVEAAGDTAALITEALAARPAQPKPEPPHPNAHQFDPDPRSRKGELCLCGWPQSNVRHRSPRAA